MKKFEILLLISVLTTITLKTSARHTGNVNAKENCIVENFVSVDSHFYVTFICVHFRLAKLRIRKALCWQSSTTQIELAALIDARSTLVVNIGHGGGKQSVASSSTSANLTYRTSAMTA